MDQNFRDSQTKSQYLSQWRALQIPMSLFPFYPLSSGSCLVLFSERQIYLEQSHTFTIHSWALAY